MDDDLELKPIELKKPVKILPKNYDDSTEDDMDIKDFKFDHGIGERYDE
jgi:hypothetical protein